MKIGILTLERYWMLRNYGTLLQCFALQTVLRRMGHEPVLIQRMHAREKRHRCDFLSHALHFCAHPVSACAGRRSLSRFLRFMREHITATEHCHADEELVVPPFEADFFICGSDQVWSHCGKAAFLSFAPAQKCISYAASAPWAECDSAWKKLAQERLPAFAGVSVREDAGEELLRGLGVQARVCADPVLLLDKADYEPLMPPATRKKPYLLVYTLNLSSPDGILWAGIRKYAGDCKLDTVVVARQGAEHHFPATVRVNPAPGELLRLFAEAACVVTNSFHGTAFSLLFEKPFACILQQGKTTAQNPRFLTLLARTAQQHRIVQGAAQLPEPLQTPCHDAAPLLNAWRAESLRFLQKSLSRIPEQP